MDASAPADHPVRRNFVLHIIGGGAFIAAMQFGSTRVVLPWISQHLAVPYILVALLLPIYQFGQVSSQFLAAPRVALVALRKHVVFRAGLVFAGLLAVIFVIATELAPLMAGISMLAAAAVLGFGMAIFGVSRSDLLAKTIASRVRGLTMARQASLAGLIILTVSFVIWAADPRLAADHLMLLWLAVGAWLAVAASYSMVREAPSKPASRRTPIAELKRGFGLIGEYPWFKRLLMLRVLLQSVELAIPFYAIHAASLHAPTARNLSFFVVAMSLGLILSGPIWGRLMDRHTGLVVVLGSLITALVGVVVLVSDAIGDPTLPFYYAVLFLPLALAREGVTQARSRQLSVRAPAKDRPALVAFSSGAMALTGILVALVIGLAGHLHDITTPLYILVALNLAAALCVRRAFAD
ncbi:MAG: MFS transporter [Pseudomonadota bacterium]